MQNASLVVTRVVVLKCHVIQCSVTTVPHSRVASWNPPGMSPMLLPVFMIFAIFSPAQEWHPVQLPQQGEIVRECVSVWVCECDRVRETDRLRHTAREKYRQRWWTETGSLPEINISCMMNQRRTLQRYSLHDIRNERKYHHGWSHQPLAVWVEESSGGYDEGPP